MSTGEALPMQMRMLRWLRRTLLFACIGLSGPGRADLPLPEDRSAAALQTRYAALGERLRDNAFRRALALDSAESATAVRGEIHAVIDHPFDAVRGALREADSWCDVLILHLNVKQCRAQTDAGAKKLTVRIGRKVAQAPEDAHPIKFAYRIAAATPRFMDVRLDAAEGPLSTRNYRIRMQAIPLPGGRTFMQFAYAYDYGAAGRLAMKTYLATIGSGKVGFTRTGNPPEPVGGVRGVVERNTMRYYLAVDAYLDALAAPPRQRFEKRLEAWFAATEQYPRQLRELDRVAYLEMKRKEYAHQQQAR